LQFIKLLDEATREQANGRPRLLHVDGHESHISYELLTYAIANNIIILGYPPHMTHILQGLDLVLFSILKNSFYDLVQKFVQLHGKDPGKDDMIDLLTPCIESAFTEEHILAAWHASGLRPVDPSAIDSSLLAPEPQGKKSYTFMLPPPSPIANMISELHGQQSALLQPPPLQLNHPPPSSPSSTPINLFPTAEKMGDPLFLLSNHTSAVDLYSEPNPFNPPTTAPSKPAASKPSLEKVVSGTRAEFLLNPAPISSSDKLPDLPPYKAPVEVLQMVKDSIGVPSEEN